MSALVSRSARLEDQLGLEHKAYAEIEDGYYTGSSARRVVAVGDLPASSVSALQLVLRANTPFKKTTGGPKAAARCRRAEATNRRPAE